MTEYRAGQPTEAVSLVEEIDELRRQREALYLTPVGDYITYDEILEQERVICPVCNRAVIEDEYLVCPKCEQQGLCMYCWEAGACPCGAGGLEAAR